MRLKTFKHLALASAIAAVLAACGGGSDSGSDPMAAASQVNDTELAWIDQPASIKWDGADAEGAAELKERRRNRDGRRGSRNGNADSSGQTTTDNGTGDTTTTGNTTVTAADGSGSNGSDAGNTTTNNNNNSDGASNNTDGTTTNNGDAGTNNGGSNSNADAGSTHSDSDSTAGNESNDDNSYTAAPDSSGRYGAPAGAASGAYGAVTFDEEWNSLDTGKWHTKMPHWNDSIPDLDNWKIENGQLKMWTPKLPNGEFLFENRAFTTHDRFNQRYGWFEMEAKLPPGQGLWPSFWLYGIYGGDRPEIDIMESHGGVDEWWGDPNPIDYGATVWLGQLDGNHERLGMVRPTLSGMTPGDLTTGFHKYGALWEPDGITFFFDGKQIGDKIHTSQMNRELWIIVGLGTGRPGDYNGPTSRTPTNSEYVINYVRAWALPGGVTTVNGRTVD